MTVDLAGLPPLAWVPRDGEGAYHAERGELLLVADAGVDWTNDSLGGGRQHRAAALSFPAPAEFNLVARIRVDPPRTTFDAGALAVWVDEDHWAKVCFEWSPAGQAMVVSVVTNDWSDDCNSSVVTAAEVWLRITRTGPAWAFHASSDGVDWQFVRLFRLASRQDARVGFLAQAPLGDRCVVRFDQIRLTGTAPADLRDGS
ncbi:DUF1349 domain-containing protein [Micromonospora sp. KC721]|uniref:DUF1349 domain-containing protein n=1 Tax=Micromonospora sp. KC721 TaxID=2530380 RepID=UPI001052281B|nr:DUF1349 domain-containing protein [Micromonospora sp. KC721]TDB81902.1 DUF1349 domain-containing protein [Micromonospora sp. KC721]